MRILVADRNALLLESIARTFGRRFSIRIATTHARCNAILRQSEFDLVVIGEKLADGPGFALLGQIARHSPDTRRVLCARRSHLQLLKGKLGVFGLFRTLTYPITPRKVLCTLRLASATSELDTSQPASRSSQPASHASEPTAVAVAMRRRVSNRPLSPAAHRPPSVAANRPPTSPPPRPRSPPAPLPLTGQPVSSSSQQMRTHRAPVRTQYLFGASMVAVFLLTTLFLNPPDISTPRREATSVVHSMPIFRAPPKIAEPLVAKPAVTQAVVQPARSEVTSEVTPIADPSTFGSEAYQAIYSD